MKSLNLKKVIAVGAGLALVAASVSAAVGWSDIADATAKNMKVNGVVVGASADVSDLTAATKLAAAFAVKATAPGEMVKETVTEKECTTVSGSEFGGESKKYDSAALAAATMATLTYTQLGEDVLKYEPTLNYKIGGASYEAYAKESLSFNTTPTFDTSSKVQRLNAEFSSDDLNYDVTFGATDAGIDFNADGTWTSGTTTWTDSGASDKVEIPFLGKTYVVHKVTLSGSTIEELELFEKGAIKVFTKGDKIEGLKGKDGKTYYAVLSSVVSDGSSVKMALYDSTGVVVSDYENESIGESEKFAEDVLESILEVTSIDNTGTSDVPNWEIEVAVGSEAVTVKDGSGFPYDSTKTSTSDYDWDATIVESFQNEEVDLTQIILENTTKYDFKNEDGLAPGDFAKFPGDLAMVKFIGLQLPEFTGVTNPKEVHTFEFGADVEEGSGTGIKYVDSAETSHEVPFYYELSVDDADSGDAEILEDSGYKVDNFVFDGKTYSLKIDYTSDNNMDVYLYEGSYAASATAQSDVITDYNESVNDGVSESQLGILNSEDDAIQYSFLTADITNGTVWLLLGAQTIDDTWDTGSDIVVVGTDVNGEAANYTTIDTNAYLPADNGDFETAYNALGTTGAEFDDAYASIFKLTVDLADTAEISMAIDTETGRALAYGASSNASNAIPGPGAQLDDDYNSADLQLKKGATNGLEEFYDEYGTKASIDSDDVISLVIPDAQALIEMKVFGKGGASTETCVDKNVEKEVEGPSVAYTGSPLSVMKDTEVTGTGNYVVVGGYFVNSLWAAKDAAETATVFGSALAKEGDSVTAVLGGSVYVAGYTKEDTAAAVDALIATLAQ